MATAEQPTKFVKHLFRHQYEEHPYNGGYHQRIEMVWRLKTPGGQQTAVSTGI